MSEYKEHPRVLGTTHDSNLRSIPTADGVRYEPAHYDERKPVSEHSPLPWTLELARAENGQRDVIRDADGATVFYADSGPYRPSDHCPRETMQRIVREVNMHAELVSLLDQASYYVAESMGKGCRGARLLHEAIEPVLAKAKGEA